MSYYKLGEVLAEIRHAVVGIFDIQELQTA